jgi:hypothetical protein
MPIDSDFPRATLIGVNLGVKAQGPLFTVILLRQEGLNHELIQKDVPAIVSERRG